MKKEKRVPTILGLIMLVGTIYLTTRLIGTSKRVLVKASQSCDPINPQVTNLTDSAATISFSTTANCLTNLSVDGYTYENLKAKGKIHYFDITKIQANKNYQFEIISDGKKYTSSSYIFKTAQKPTNNIPASNLAWGKIYTPENNPASQAIVYLNIPGASPLSALVTSDGYWNVSLAVSFNESLSSWFVLPSDIEEDIIVLAPDYPTTQIVGNTSRNNPVPDIILGQNNFSSPSAVIIPPSEITQESLLNSDINLMEDKDLDILNPKTDETINSLKPDIFGTASKNSQLKIKIESPVVYQDTISTDSNGEWNWSPPQNLTPGSHTVTVTDEKNNQITRKFVVLAAESSKPVFSASESATKITTTPTKKLTPTPSKTITPTPTKKITPTDIPVTRPSTASGIPKTGMALPTFTLITLSSLCLACGLVYSKKS